jgi:hypothetical protein
MQTNYSWDDLKSYFKDNEKFPEVYEKLLREEERVPEIKKETCKELSGLIFRIDWKGSPEGRPWWFNVYNAVMEEDRRIAEIQT